MILMIQLITSDFHNFHALCIINYRMFVYIFVKSRLFEPIVQQTRCTENLLLFNQGNIYILNLYFYDNMM